MKLIMRKTTVQWKGGHKGGTQVLSSRSNVLKHAKISSTLPAKNGSAMDPVEMMAAAYAGSFTLALSNEPRLADSLSGIVITTATVTMERLPAGWTILNIHLNVTAKLPRVTQAEFIDAIVRAKTNCLISRLLHARTSMTATLEK
jgi:osmotically inducible protein OsmC